ncbi:unnamed protein product [Bursaphelenchus xylophilus]|uniref:(pine wood nematode) hypothetical protein n=1 Tax=Bursaphelenchus xylophilus TaxID=6326 RepID=A0A1I7RNF3_BURXY|nr:unnamed protein product [Bursaphelenchus xylophilus]CAG9123954.1 unnamed protein product [Bursaphelenchus xylophilus]
MSRILFLPTIFVTASAAIWIMITSAPDWHSDQAGFEIPKQFDNFTTVVEKFKKYHDQHYIYITILFCSVYLYKQTFAIPGSFLLNVIAGAVFDMGVGFMLVCVLTTMGSTFCYLFSELCFGRENAYYYFGQRMKFLQQKVEDNSHGLVLYLLFARMFPISPSWLLNVVAPFLNIPIPTFAFTAFVGLAPYNFICVQAGSIISDLKSWDDVMSTSTMLKLSSLALLPLFLLFFVKPRSKRVITIQPRLGYTHIV